MQNLVVILKEFLNSKLKTGAHCTVENLYNIKVQLLTTFNIKFLNASVFANGKVNSEDQEAQTHNKVRRIYKKILQKIC